MFSDFIYCTSYINDWNCNKMIETPYIDPFNPNKKLKDNNQNLHK